MTRWRWHVLFNAVAASRRFGCAHRDFRFVGRFRFAPCGATGRPVRLPARESLQYRYPMRIASNKASTPPQPNMIE